MFTACRPARRAVRASKVLPVALGLLCCLIFFVSGCKRSSGAGGASGQASKKKFYWVQGLRNHPVHQLTQHAFREGCEKLGYDSEVVGTFDMNAPATIALAEQVLAKGDTAGLSIWAADPSFYPLIAEAGNRHIPVIIVHFPVQEDVPGLTSVSSCDPAQYAHDCAIAMGEQINQHCNGKGTVAITQGTTNLTEDQVTAVFTKTINEKFPAIKVMAPDMEGFEPTAAIAKASNILRAHPDVVAALTTTGGEPPTWPSAATETGRTVINIGMNYTRANLDAVRDGKMYAIAGQPLWEESYQAAELLDKAIRGEKVDKWSKLPAPLITKDKLAPYYAIMDKADAAAKK